VNLLGGGSDEFLRKQKFTVFALVRTQKMRKSTAFVYDVTEKRLKSDGDKKPLLPLRSPDQNLLNYCYKISKKGI
jgi:hypothetical protein